MPSPELWCGACEDRGTVPCPRCAEEETPAECPLCEMDLRVPCPDCTEREIVEMERETLDVLVRQRNDAEAEIARLREALLDIREIAAKSSAGPCPSIVRIVNAALALKKPVHGVTPEMEDRIGCAALAPKEETDE